MTAYAPLTIRNGKLENLQAADSLLVGTSIDTISAGTLTVGGTTATQVTLGASGIPTVSAGAFTANTTSVLTGLATFDAGITQSGGAVSLTATGASHLTSTAALTLTGGAASTWSTSAGALTLTSAAAATWSTTAGALTLTSAAAATWSTAAGALTLNGTAGINLQKGAATYLDVGVTTTGALTVAANTNVAALTGTTAFDFSVATGLFKTSTGANTLSGSSVTVTSLAGSGSGYVAVNNSGVLSFTSTIVATSASSIVISGITTTAMTGGSGTFGYVSGNGAVTPTDNGTYAKATSFGAFEGTSGSMTTSGVVSDAQFTTTGGSPTAGQLVYLAAATDDTGAGAGKLTATAPTTVGASVTVVGICLDNTNYSGSKTSSVLLQTQAPIQL